MPKRRRHDDHEEHVNHEAWVIPYADMLTLLMGLFLVLWSMSTTDLAKLEQLRESLAEGFGVGSSSDAAPPSVIESSEGGLLDGGLGGIGPGVAAGARASDPTQLHRAFAALDRESAHAEAVEAASDELDQIETMIQQSADAAGVSASISMRREARGLVVTVVTDQVLFEPGSADLQPQGRGVLDLLVPAMRQFHNPLAIEGHTDNDPISNGRFPSNWELSTSRATSVLRYLVESHAFEGSRLTAAGYGEERPIGDNNTTTGKAANRRVELVVLSDVPLADVTGAPIDG